MPDLFSTLFQNISGPSSTGTADIFQPGLSPFSFSGVNPGTASPILSKIAPMLQNSLTSLSGTPNSIASANAKPVFTGILNNLASNRMLNSSVASDALGKGISGLSGQAATQQSQIPMMLGQLLQSLGGMSYSSDPLAPYQLLSQFALGY